MSEMTAIAERRVLALLLADPGRIAETRLKAEDFEFDYHRMIFQSLTEKKTGDLLALGLPDDVIRYALDLDENFAPENLAAWSRIVREATEQCKFARSVGRLRGNTRRPWESAR